MKGVPGHARRKELQIEAFYTRAPRTPFTLRTSFKGNLVSGSFHDVCSFLISRASKRTQPASRCLRLAHGELPVMYPMHSLGTFRFQSWASKCVRQAVRSVCFLPSQSFRGCTILYQPEKQTGNKQEAQQSVYNHLQEKRTSR